MDDSTLKQLRADLMRHEGRVVDQDGQHKMYRCPLGAPTIGYGRNLRDNPLSVGEQIHIFEKLGCRLTEEAALYLLDNDIKDSRDWLLKNYPWVADFKPDQQRGLINMVFQLGAKSFSGFKRSLEHLQERNWVEAGRRLRQSLWYGQTPKRAEEVIQLIEKG